MTTTTTQVENPALLERFRGRILALKEMNGYDDSDFYAFVEHDDGKFDWFEYATTRFGSNYRGAVDATEEVRARYTAWWLDRQATAQEAQTEYEEAMLAKGKRAKVVKGRKFKGQEGEIRWIGVDQYKSNYHQTAMRVGLFLDGAETQKLSFVPATQILLETPSGEWVEPVDAIEYKSRRIGRGTSVAMWVFCQFPDPARLRPATNW